MKTRTSNPYLALLLCPVVLTSAALNASAATLYWGNSAADSNFNTITNWRTDAGGATPALDKPVSGDDAIFNVTALTTDQNVSLNNTAQVVRSVTFASTGRVLLSSAAATNFEVESGGITVNSGSGASAFSTGCQVLVKESLSIANNGTSSLNFVRALSTSADLGPQTLTFNGTGGVTDFNTGISQGSGTTLAVTINTAPGATTILRSAGTISGGYNLVQGRLALRSSTTYGATGNILTISGGRIGAVVSNRTVGNSIVINGDFEFGLVGHPTTGDLATVSSNNINFTGPVDLSGGTRTITNVGNSNAFSGAISNGNLTLGVGSGNSLTLSGENTYGNTTVNGGTMSFTKVASLPGYNEASRVSVNSGGTLRVNAGGPGEWVDADIDALLGATTAAFSSGSVFGINVPVDTVPDPDVPYTYTYPNDIAGAQSAKGFVKSGGGTLTLTGTNTHTGGTSVTGGILILGNATDTISGAVTVSGGTLDVDNPETVDAVTLTAGTISGDSILTGTSYDVREGTVSAVLAGGALTKTTGSTVALTGNNTYSGGTTLSGGRVNIGSGSAFGSAPISVTASSTIGGGVFTVANNIDIAATTLNLDVESTFTGILSGSGELRNTSGSSDPVFSNLGNTFTGNVTVAGSGTISFASLADSGQVSLGGGVPGSFVWTGGDVTFNTRAFRTVTTAANTAIIRNNNIASTLTINTNFLAEQTANTALNLRGDGRGVFAGTIGDSTVGTFTTGITKNDAGTWTLSGTNTYSGATTVTLGTLKINGNNSAATGAVSVAANATLGGTGTVGGNTTIADTGKLEFDLSTAPGSHNKLDMAASKTLTFSGASTLTLTSSGGASTGLYTLVTAPGAASIIGSAPATVVLPSGWTADPPVIVADGPNTSLQINITSTGVVVTPYDTWVALYQPGFTNNLPGQDQDSDGLTNQQEFAFGLNPKSGSSVNPITVFVAPATGNFSYTRNANSALTYKVWTSTTLAVGSWIEATGATQTPVGVPDAFGTQTVNVTTLGATPVGGKLFVRVTAE